MEASKPDLTPDDATTQGSIRDTSDAVALVGYLGEGSSDQHRRLYENVALERWIEILVEDVVHRVSAAGGDDPTAGQSVIWVRRDAKVERCESLRASSFEAGPEGPPQAGLAWPRP